MVALIELVGIPEYRVEVVVVVWQLQTVARIVEFVQQLVEAVVEFVGCVVGSGTGCVGLTVRLFSGFVDFVVLIDRFVAKPLLALGVEVVEEEESTLRVAIELVDMTDKSVVVEVVLVVEEEYIVAEVCLIDAEKSFVDVKLLCTVYLLVGIIRLLIFIM